VDLDVILYLLRKVSEGFDQINSNLFYSKDHGRLLEDAIEDLERFLYIHPANKNVQNLLKMESKMLCIHPGFVIRINSVWIKLVIFLNIGNKKK
jgi:hypothetical protein